jgi:hypothetical protein
MGCCFSKGVQVTRMLRGQLADPPILVGDKKKKKRFLGSHQARSAGIPLAPQVADSTKNRGTFVLTRPGLPWLQSPCALMFHCPAAIPLKDTMEGVSAPLSTTSTAQRRFSAWAVRPGYSSGASSVAMDEEEDEEQDEAGLDEVPEMRAEVTLSKHTSVLALSDLRLQNQLGHNLASSVVRIEVRGIGIKPFDFVCAAHDTPLPFAV